MIGKKDRWQEDLFVAAPLCSLIPDDHILKRVDKVLDLSWVKNEVADLYCDSNGRPSIAPEAALRLMLAGFFHGIIHDRKLMRDAQVNLAIRWFAGYRLNEVLPDHSSLTRIRQRWGQERFQRIFKRIVQQCVQLKLVNCDTVHIDATLIRADVSWDNIIDQHVEAVVIHNSETDDAEDAVKGYRQKISKTKKFCKTDPEATIATSSRNGGVEPSYKQHTAVDDSSGMIIDISVTTGEVNEGDMLLKQVDQIQEVTGQKISTVTADSGYAYAKIYSGLEKRDIDPIIPPKKVLQSDKAYPQRRFKYDGKHKIVRCPAGKTLYRSSRARHGWYYRSSCLTCRDCPIRFKCLPPKADRRTIVISDGHEALLRARRRRAKWDKHIRDIYTRHKWRVEGAHGEAKIQHHLARAARRGLYNVAIQAYLTAIVMNLKRLAAFFAHFLYQDAMKLTAIQHCKPSKAKKLQNITGLFEYRLKVA